MKKTPPPNSTALIVDDEKDTCFLLSHILKQQLIKTRIAGTLADAEKALNSEAPGLIFLDNHLPDGLGVENIRKFKAKLPGTWVILLTAHDNPADRKKASREGVDFFISKPYSKETIYRVLEKIWDTRVA